MLIRTQDRKRIVNFNNLISISCLEMAVYAEIDNGTGFFKLGEYKDNERAMEVLAKMWDGVWESAKLFQMPKE